MPLIKALATGCGDRLTVELVPSSPITPHAFGLELLQGMGVANWNSQGSIDPVAAGIVTHPNNDSSLRIGIIIDKITELTLSAGELAMETAVVILGVHGAATGLSLQPALRIVQRSGCPM